MHRRTTLLLPFLGLLAVPALGFADQAPSSSATSARAPVLFWGIRQECFVDGMVGDAIASRAAVGSVPMTALRVARNAGTMTCFGKACIDEIRKDAGCSSLDLSGGVIGGEAAEITEQGQRIYKLHLWKYVAATDSVIEHEAVCRPDGFSNRTDLARCAAEKVTELASDSFKNPVRLADTPECKALTVPVAPVVPVTPAAAEKPAVYYAVTYSSKNEMGTAKSAREHLEKRFSSEHNLVRRSSKANALSAQGSAPSVETASEYLRAVPSTESSAAPLLLLTHIHAKNSTCGTWFRRGTDGNIQKLGETCGPIEVLDALPLPDGGSSVAPIPPPLEPRIASAKPKTPDFCRASIPQCPGSFPFAAAAVTRSGPSLNKSLLSRGPGWIPIIGTGIGLATMIGLGVADRTYRISWPENPSWQSPEHLMASAFWTATGLTIALGASAAAVVVDHVQHQQKAQSGSSPVACSFLPEVQP